jgi:hypothetical protein
MKMKRFTKCAVGVLVVGMIVLGMGAITYGTISEVGVHGWQDDSGDISIFGILVEGENLEYVGEAMNVA